MPAERKVVVIVSPEHLHSSEVGIFAARIMPMGLTGYGHAKDEATRKVKKMFVAMVKAHRTQGDLEEWLDRSKLEWHWLDEYKGNVPVEHPESPEDGTLRVPAANTPSPWSETPTETGIAA